MKTLKIAGACLNQTPLDWGGNLDHILQAIAAARAEGAGLLCLPELAISGYGCEDAFFSGYILEQSLESLAEIVKASEGIAVSVGLPISLDNCLYNGVCMIHDGAALGFVAKQELAGDGLHYEPRWFKRWPDSARDLFNWRGKHFPFGDLIFEIDGARVGFEICEDAWHGRRPALDHYRHNVDIILNPSASHFAFGKSAIRQGLVVEASRSYKCAYVYSNLVGNEAGRVIYDGEILIAQNGRLLARNRRFSYEDCQVLAAAVDLSVPRREKKKLFSFQPEAAKHVVRSESPLTFAEVKVQPEYTVAPMLDKHQEFFQATTLALFDYMRKSRSRGFALSLSGGADSSCCAVIAAYSILNARRELGDKAFLEKLAYLDLGEPIMKQLLVCVYQATENSSEETRAAAEALAAELEAEFHAWNVDQIVADYRGKAETALGRELTWETDDLALQNIQARSRAPGVWMLANVRNALLITTSNRSEAAVGYATMDGDTAGGIAPVAGFDKASLIHWLRWAEKELGLASLYEINRAQPSAELRPPDENQQDETDLMPYPVLDQIEKCAIRDYKSPLETFRTLRGLEPDELLAEHIVKFFGLWSRNQWKRERYAPSFHLDDENLDPRTWCRYPILNGGYKKEILQLKEWLRGQKEAQV